MTFSRLELARPKERLEFFISALLNCRPNPWWTGRASFLEGGDDEHVFFPFLLRSSLPLLHCAHKAFDEAHIVIEEHIMMKIRKSPRGKVRYRTLEMLK
jgi:hypothetical protein